MTEQRAACRERLAWCAQREFVCRHKLIGLPQPHHVCTSECAFYECRGIKEEPCFVCRFSQKVHVCGTFCDRRETSKNQEGVVCTLTGRVLAHEQLCQHFVTRSKERPNQLNGTNYQRGLDRKGKRRKPAQSVQKAANRIKRQINGALQTILFSTERKAILETHTDRFRNECRRLLRSPPMLSADHDVGINTVKAYMQCQELADKYAAFLNPPAPRPDETVVHRIVDQIFEYFNRFTEIKATGRAVAVFTACIVSRLASGYSINGVEVIKQSGFFKGYAPHDLVYSRLPGFTCRAISLMQRQIHSHIVSDNGFPKRKFFFALKSK